MESKIELWSTKIKEVEWENKLGRGKKRKKRKAKGERCCEGKA